MDPLTVVGLVVLAAVLALFAIDRAFVSKEDRERFLREAFVKKDLPKIWRKTGLLASIWTARLQCPRDGSRMYEVKGEWHDMFGDSDARTNAVYVCPVCLAEFWHENDPAGLNTFRLPDPGT